MAKTSVRVFDLNTRALVELDRYDARHLLSVHRIAAVDPPPGDLLAVCWWSVLPDPGARTVQLREPAIYFGAPPLSRRIVMIPPPVLAAHLGAYPSKQHEVLMLSIGRLAN